MSLRPMVLRALKPGALSVLIFLTIVLPASIYYSPLSASISLEDGTTEWQIPWPFFAGCAVAGYLAAQILAAVFRQATGFRRPARAYLLTVAAAGALALLAAIGFSKFYWGYFFFRPPPLAEIAEVQGLPAVAVVAIPENADAESDFVFHPSNSPDNDLAYAHRNPYDAPEGRLLIELGRRGQLPATFATSLSNVPPLLPLARRSGLIVPAEPGYDGDRQLGGYVVEAVDLSGARLLFLAIRGSQISNDHYPCYEMLFMAPASTADFQFVRGQRFFFDVAGIEGAEWHIFWIAFALMGIPLAFAAVVAAMTVGRGLAWIRNKGG